MHQRPISGGCNGQAGLVIIMSWTSGKPGVRLDLFRFQQIRNFLRLHATHPFLAYS